MYLFFVVDTSASMLQRTYNGMSLLDIAKACIEHFLKIRMREGGGRADKLMLLTTEEDVGCALRLGWKDQNNEFLKEVKAIRATGGDLSDIGLAISRAFDILNQFRMQIGLETFGHGHLPWHIEPGFVFVFTDRQADIASRSGMGQFISPAPSTLPASRLVRENFRWDQRLFSIELLVSGVQSSSPAVRRATMLTRLAERTGGRGYVVPALPLGLNVCEEIAKQLIVPAVCVSMSPVEKNPEIPIFDHRLLNVSKSGTWPIPESYFPSKSLHSVPIRDAHPTVLFNFRKEVKRLIIPEGFPVDQYEVEESTFSKTVAALSLQFGDYEVYVPNSGPKPGLGAAFGFLRGIEHSKDGHPVLILHILPYDFPTLFGLLQQVKNRSWMTTSSAPWKSALEKYLLSVPVYYVQPIRTVLSRYGIPGGAFPSNVDGFLPQAMGQSLVSLKKEAIEKAEDGSLRKTERESLQIIPQPPLRFGMKLSFGNFFRGNVGKCNASLMEKKDCVKELDLFEGRLVGARKNLEKLLVKKVHGKALVDDVDSQKAEDEKTFCVPISIMSNFVPYMKHVLRDHMDDENVSRPSFGNPFRKIKSPSQQEGELDERDDEAVMQETWKRKNNNRKGFRPFYVGSNNGYDGKDVQKRDGEDSGNESQTQEAVKWKNTMNEVESDSFCRGDLRRMQLEFYNANGTYLLAHIQTMIRTSRVRERERLISLIEGLSGPTIAKVYYIKHLEKLARRSNQSSLERRLVSLYSLS